MGLEWYLILFFIFLLLLALAAYFIQNRRDKIDIENIKQDETAVLNEIKSISHFNHIEIFLGKDIMPFDFYILELVANARKNIAKEYGVIIPEIKIQHDSKLRPTEYVINIQEKSIDGWFIIPTQYLAISDGVCNDLDGIRVLEPIDNHCAIWIDEDGIENAKEIGYTVIKDFEIISIHLLSILKQNIYKFINRDYTHCLLESLTVTNPVLVEEIQSKFTYGDIKNILIDLLKCNKSIRNLELILEISLDNSDNREAIIEEITKYI